MANCNNICITSQRHSRTLNGTQEVPSVKLKALTSTSPAPLQGADRRFDPYSAHHQIPGAFFGWISSSAYSPQSSRASRWWNRLDLVVSKEGSDEVLGAAQRRSRTHPPRKRRATSDHRATTARPIGPRLRRTAARCRPPRPSKESACLGTPRAVRENHDVIVAEPRNPLYLQRVYIARIVARCRPTDTRSLVSSKVSLVTDMS